MANNEEKAQKSLSEGDRKLKLSNTFLGSMFGGNSKVEEALECYKRAGNLFKMSKNWLQAGEAFTKAALLCLRQDMRYDAALNYADAANCFKRSEEKKAAVNSFISAIEICTDMGRFTMAAKYHLNIAEMYEQDNMDEAIQHYEQAADYYRGEENNQMANKCLLKVAQHSAIVGNYEKAIFIFDGIVAFYLESSLLKYSVKEVMFKALLCHLCVDSVDAENALKRYISMCPSFEDSREHKLLRNILMHIEEENLDGFTDAVKEYDSISRLDSWYTALLLKIKRGLSVDVDIR